jgi:photosystem II stability/assembly factor-like uncharacterized protein
VPITPLAVRRLVFTLAVVLAASSAFAQGEQQKTKQPAATQNPAPPTPLVSEKEKEKEDPLFRGMEYRPIGPFRGGRSLTATGIPGDPTTYYFGSTGGGVWKSTDGALTWTSVFDKEGTSSIGSIAIAPSEPTTVYVGTGEACIRGNISHGDGVYKSLDAGKTWTNIGLRDTRAIGRLIVHPRNPNIVFVAALGHPYGPNPERGVFRTTDGGKTWEKVLYKDENTGAIDIRFDPNNPNVLFAALWQARRMPWRLDNGGPGSGIYRSDDGGTTWKQITEHGLPKPPYGRIGVSVAANSERVYALIEAKDGGLYRSDDGGEEWQLVSDNHALRQRPWYYMHVFADPQDPETVYVLDVDAYKSTDGGRTFNKVKIPHGDNHNLWIDPRNPRRMAASNDGGVTVSIDGGKTWSRQDNQPTAQFYHVATDTRTPYYVYGAQQDNSTIAIASRSEEGEIGRVDWYAVGGGEAGYIAPYPTDPLIVFAGDYEGNLTRYDRHTGQTKNIGVNPELSDGQGAATLEHRFQWTAPLVISPHDPNAIYYGGERVFKSTNQGMSWEAISPDLTRNDKSKQQPSGGAVTIDDTGTEYYDTVFTIAESPVTKGLIWAGTDDGLVQLTRDGGKNWSNVTPKDMPEWSRISLIEASPHNPGTAYAAVERHQFDDIKPYIYKTTDYGATWAKLGKGIPDTTFVRAVREDPKNSNLLYAGTEMGVFVSFNGGADWRPMQLNLPRAPIHDLMVKDNDLVLATHGRSFWILDDVSPLRQFSDKAASSDVFLYKPGEAYRFYSQEEPAKHLLSGKNPPLGAAIYFYVKQAPKEDDANGVKIEILDSKGSVVRTYSSKKDVPLEEPRDPDDEKPKKEIKLEDGMNRVVWDLHYEDAHTVPGYFLYEYKDGAKGPMALPGEYKVRLTANGKTLTEPFEVKLDPRVKVAPADLEKQFELLSSIHTQLNRVYDAANQIEDVRAQLKGLARRLPEEASARQVRESAGSLAQKLTEVGGKLVNLKIKANEDALAYAPAIDGKLAYLAMAVASQSDSAPTDAEYHLFDRLKKQSDDYLAQWSELQKSDVAGFQKQLAGQGIPAIVIAPAKELSGEGEGQ